MGKWEGFIILVLVLGGLLAELRSVRRSIRKDKEGSKAFFFAKKRKKLLLPPTLQMLRLFRIRWCQCGVVRVFWFFKKELLPCVT